MSTNLSEGSTTPAFITDFEGARFIDEPLEGGGTFAVGQEEDINIIIFPETGEINDVFAGGNDTDVIQALNGDDNIQGGLGTDFVFGGEGDDIVRGGEGDDVVVGNEGSDILISGSGSDIYEFFANQFVEGDVDLILDFEVGLDAIVVVGSTDVSYDATSGFLSVDGLDVAIVNGSPDLSVLDRSNSAVVF
ncbi:MAG: calcium-binding protein [Symploca sp. SIO2E9]|nr:calcium-binding protein [Symploca sp. SIO2E9]